VVINEELERCRKVRQDLVRKYGGLDGLCAHLRKLDKALGIKKVGDKPRGPLLRTLARRRRKVS